MEVTGAGEQAPSFAGVSLSERKHRGAGQCRSLPSGRLNLPQIGAATAAGGGAV
jgi:hypothetical protein